MRSQRQREYQFARHRQFEPGAFDLGLVKAKVLTLSLLLCQQELGSVKAPKSVEFWPELPRSAVGKARKKDMRGKFWVGRDRAI